MQKPKLILLHFAGGNCYSFNFLNPFLTSFEVLTPELPGRGMRSGEKLIVDFELGAKDLFNQVNSFLSDDTPFIIYGHSMGGYFALKLTSMLENIGKRPACLFVSGNGGPGSDPNKERYKLQGEDFVAELRKLGGVPEEVIKEKEMLQFFEPILRSDFQLAAENGLETLDPVNVPIYALMGDKEETVEQISGWSKFTKNEFQSDVWEGGHFFIQQHPQKLGQLIKSFYEKCKLKVLT